MIEPVITFEPDTHTYSVDDGPGPRAVRSVTQRLEDAGISDFSGVPDEILWAAQQRGTMVHLAAHYINKRNLDPESIDERIGGYVEAWKKFRRDKQLKIRHSEHLVYRRISIHGADAILPQPTDLEIIGTLDWEGSIINMADVIGDIKTGDETEAWPIQLAAYTRAFSRRAPFTHKRLVVQLERAGNYRLHWYKVSDFARDFERFRLALIAGKRTEQCLVS